MPYLLVYAGTVVVSTIMDIDFSLQLTKDIADAGGKLNAEKTKELKNLLPANLRNRSLLFKIIPIVNVIFSFVNRVNYERQRNTVLNQLNLLGVIDEMTDLEKEIYNEKPTRFNAIMAPIKCAIRLNSADVLEIDNEYESSKIYYEVSSEGPTKVDVEQFKKRVTILQVEGDASRLTLDEQKEEIVIHLKTKEVAEKFNGKLALIEYAEKMLEDESCCKKDKEIYDYIKGLSPEERERLKRILAELKRMPNESASEPKQEETNAVSLKYKRNKQ